MEKRDNKRRISARKEISFLIKKGLFWKCQYFSIAYCENSGLFDRCAIIVSKKNGNAVQRNKIKRVYKEVIRKNKSNTPPYFDILVKPVGILLPPAEDLKSSYLTWEKLVKK